MTQPPPPTTSRESRIAAHSHIKGLGLADDGTAMELSQGFVGQRPAREALGLHLQLLKMGKHSGRPLLLVGPPGTGKVSEHLLTFFTSVLARARGSLRRGSGSAKQIAEGVVLYWTCLWKALRAALTPSRLLWHSL